MVIDTHSHLDGPEFQEDIGQVIERAKQAGVEKIFLPNVNLADHQHLLDLCHQYPGYLYPMIGLHPEEVKEDYQSQLDQLNKLLESNIHQTEHQHYIAIGEIGLDFYWDETYRKQQIDTFHQQIQWAIHYNLPLMIHARKAQAELVEALNQYRGQNLRGVFHCFSGTEEEARQLLSFDNFMLGIGGVLTFKKSKLPEVLRNSVPISRIVLETDSPYLAPTPHRGKRNESAFIIETLRHLSLIYECKIENIALETKKNAENIML